MVHPSTDEVSVPPEAEEPPDASLRHYAVSNSKPLDVHDPPSRHTPSKNGLVFSSDLRPTQDPSMSPHSFTSSVATDATTPRFGCSPGHTDSLSGSPSSISSMMSIASYRRGDTADTEDDPDTDLYPVNEDEELDSHALASMDISDVGHAIKDAPPPTSTTASTLQPPVEPRRTQSAPVLSKPLKGRVFELLADEDDSGSSGASSPHDWDGEIQEPPPPQLNVTPMDTVPPVPSPLCMSISGDTMEPAPMLLNKEELRDLHMPMDLLASRWSALKLPGKKGSMSTKAPKLPAYDVWHSTAMQTPATEQPLPASGPTCLPAMETENAPVVPTSSMAAPTATAHRDPVAELKAIRPPTPTHYGPTGVSRSYAVPPEPQQGLSSSLTDSLAARFGLTKPPPPLPGVAPSSGPRRTQSDSKLYPMPQTLRATSRNSRVTQENAVSVTAHAGGYESPSTDLGDYGVEYAMMGGS
ncbi:hypothetical protein MEQU1_001183 [Malassezia equina]|uniref:Uncharacterized protein n=1 Tax=Malassezia equina TaxID=1381935 RepID=A0AAF0ED72_9BASI|nr:hypothetical protein MEQU1_001183 [Malassezia equina]